MMKILGYVNSCYFFSGVFLHLLMLQLTLVEDVLFCSQNSCNRLASIMIDIGEEAYVEVVFLGCWIFHILLFGIIPPYMTF